jgi:prepilin-type processing-associated H-X9-DG protein
MRLKQKPAIAGFTLLDLVMIVAAVCVIGYLLMPRLTGGKTPATRINCRNNLKQVGLAYRQWAIDHNDKFPMEVSVTNGGAMEAVLSGDTALVFRVMSNELNTPKLLFCQTDKRRVQANSFTRATTRNNDPFLNNSNVSYFVGLDASPSAPQMLLSGDDNWLIGGRESNIGVGRNGLPVRPGLLPWETNTLVAWSDARHARQGNVGLADGSVQGWSSSKLAEGLRQTGITTNRLVFP